MSRYTDSQSAYPSVSTTPRWTTRPSPASGRSPALLVEGVDAGNIGWVVIGARVTRPRHQGGPAHPAARIRGAEEVVSDLRGSVDRSSPWLRREIFEVCSRGRRLVRLRRWRDRLRRLRPFAADNRARRAGPRRRVSDTKPSSGAAPVRAPGRSSPALDPAATAHPGCMRPAVDDLSAGGLVGLDVDLAGWSRWHLLVASGLMASRNGGARSRLDGRFDAGAGVAAGGAGAGAGPLSEPARLAWPGQRLRSLSASPPPAAGDSPRRPRGPSHRVSNGSVSKDLPTRGREGCRQRCGHVPVATRGPGLARRSLTRL